MITTAQVISWADLKGILTDDEDLSLVVGFVNHYVDTLPTIDRLEDGLSWAPNTTYGALLLANKMYRRKNSPDGIVSLGESTMYVSRFDSDISRALNLGDHLKPVIG